MKDSYYKIKNTPEIDGFLNSNTNILYNEKKNKVEYSHRKFSEQDKDNYQYIKLNSSFAENMTIDSIEEIPKSQLEELKIKIFKFLSVRNWAILTVILSWLFLVMFSLYLFNNKYFFIT